MTNFCDNCGHQYSDICGICETLDGVPVKYSEKKKTKADLIRAMNDEELAEYHVNLCNDVWQLFVENPKQMWLEWLKQEAEE